MQNLVKASTLPKSKVRQFLLSKPSYAKFTLVSRNIKRTKAFARFENEVWCMDLAYIDKLGKNIRVVSVQFLLLPYDLFDRNVVAKVMKIKRSKEILRAF